MFAKEFQFVLFGRGNSWWISTQISDLNSSWGSLRQSLAGFFLRGQIGIIFSFVVSYNYSARRRSLKAAIDKT